MSGKDAATPRVRLPLIKIIWGTFAFPRMFAGAFVSDLAVPLVVLIGCLLVWALHPASTPAAVQGLAVGVGCVLFSWLAIRCHRLVLLGSGESVPLPLRDALRIIAPFAGTLAGLWLVQMFITLLLIGLIVNIFPVIPPLPAGTPPDPAVIARIPPDPAVQRLIGWITLAASFPGFYLIARLCLVFPSLAVGEKWNLRLAWQRSRGNGWRLAVIAIALPKLFTYGVNLLYRADASAVEFGVLLALLVVLIALEVIAVSLSFRELAAPAPPPTTRPA